MRRHRMLWALLTIAAATGAPVSVAAEPLRYVVKDDDTVFSIARSFGIPMSAVIRANSLADPNVITTGTALTIPRTHVVEKGEGYLRIARENGTTMEELLAVNGLSEDHVLQAGEVLRLPAGAGGEDRASEIFSGSSSGGAEPPYRDNDRPSDVQDRADAEIASETSPEPEPAKDSDDSVTTGEQHISDMHSAEVLADQTGIGSSVPFWPLSGRLVRKKGRIPGAEIVGQPGEMVYSVSSGIVVWVAPFRGYGDVVMIETFDNYLYLYGWTANSVVAPGEWVPAGARIADLARNPYTGEARLFFTVFKNGEIVDPEDAPRG